ncbi:MAG TPA: hypothetical protein VD886_02375, partial [Herpetosiphonaceae bacterium]|nr:hypothetical protein [Herpetosiphonaceae bacterium]
LRDGMTIEEAMVQVYDLNLDAFEDRWRAAVGAPARSASPGAPAAGASPAPTVIPTHQPALPQASSGAAAPADASPASPAPTGGLPLGAILLIAGAALMAGAGLLIVIQRRRA